MPSYLLLLLAVVSRIVPHPWHFTAVGGSLLYFGARRPLRQAVIPVALLALTDYYLTSRVYGYPFHVSDSVLTWVWYAAAIVLGSILLRKRASATRVVSATVLSSTSFFLVSNFAVWQNFGSYPHTFSGLMTCYAAGLPFYPNDLMSTLLVTSAAFGLPALARQLSEWRAGHHPAST
jgi:hypothetical protein